MKKRNVILVNSLFNIITAVQIRCGIFENEPFDLVLSDECPGLELIYENGCLNDVFDYVYYAKTKNISRLDRIVGLLFPRRVLRKALGKKMLFYSDIFFWNPDRIFYFYYMELNRLRKKFRLHVYGEGIAGYTMEGPDSDRESEYFQYSHKVLNDFVRKKYSVKKVVDMEYDYYMFAPENTLITHKKKVVEIPPVDVSDDKRIKLYNKIYKYNNDIVLSEKYVFLASVPEETTDPDLYRKSIRKICSIVGEDNFIVKLHPRTPEREIGLIGVKVVQQCFPWELYCMNNDISNKVFITENSSAAILPSILFEKRPQIVLLSYISNVYGVGSNIINSLFDMVNTKYRNVCVISDYNELNVLCNVDEN